MYVGLGDEGLGFPTFAGRYFRKSSTGTHDDPPSKLRAGALAQAHGVMALHLAADRGSSKVSGSRGDVRIGAQASTLNPKSETLNGKA